MMKSYIDFKFEELEKKVINLIEDKDKINQANDYIKFIKKYQNESKIAT